MDGMTQTGIEVRQLAGALGAEVSGALLETMNGSDFERVKQDFLDHQVLVFRDQKLDPEAYVRIAHRFGFPVPYPFATGIEGHPEITVIIKEPHQTSNFGGMWHSDTTYKPEPPKATMLYCRETPDAGGDTIFACQYRAFEALSTPMQKFLSGIKGISSSAKNAASLRGTHLATGSMQGTRQPETLHATHPVVRVHPETGRKALYVNRSHTIGFEGMSEAESSPILEFLFQHQIQPEFTARVRWQPGTVVIWDNRSSQHCAINDYDGHRRDMWRITLGGDAPR
ncbi:MAG: TauD/TfdA family dioxygenase [Pseudomonadota bacterium]